MSTLKSVAAAALCLVASAGAASAEAWGVSEGPGGKTTGVWNVTISAGVISGDAMMTTPEHQRLRYGLTGKVDGTNYVINRVGPSDRNLCTYKGAAPQQAKLKKPTEITGSAMCQQKSGIWKVKIMTVAR